MQDKTIDELQKYVQKFIEERNWQNSPSEILVHIIEELGEVARNILHMKNYGGQHTSDKKTNMDEELADLLYLLLKMANECKINLAEAFSLKMKKNEQRFPRKA